MNYLTLLNDMTSEQHLANLQQHLNERNLLDENRNLSLEKSSENRDFLELFFYGEGISSR